MKLFSRKSLAILLVIAMLFSLFPGISAKAVIVPQYLKVSRDKDWSNGIPIPDMDNLGDSDGVIIKSEDLLYLALVRDKSGGGYEISAELTEQMLEEDISIQKIVARDPVYEDDISKATLVATEAFHIEAFKRYDEKKGKDVAVPGFYYVSIDEPGEYAIFYKQNSYVIINAYYPEAGIYPSPNYSQDTFLGRNIYFSYDEENTYYVHIDREEAYYSEIINVYPVFWENGDVNSLNVLEFKAVLINKDGKEFETGDDPNDFMDFKITIAKECEVDFEVEVEYGIAYPGEEEPSVDKVYYHFEPIREGLCIAGTRWDDENHTHIFPPINWFGKNMDSELPGEAYFSLGWIGESGEVAPITDIQNLSVNDEKGNPVTISNKEMKWDDSQNKDVEVDLNSGIYHFPISGLQTYKISYVKNEKTYTVKVTTDFPRVGVYNSETQSVENLMDRDEITYNPGETYYLITNDDCKNNENITKIRLNLQNPFEKEEIEWKHKEGPYELIIPDDAFGYYDKAVMVYFDNKDGSSDWHQINLTEKKEGLMITHSDWENDQPIVKTNVDEFSRALDVEIGDNKIFTVGMLTQDENENVSIYYPKKNEISNIELYDSSNTKVTDEKAGVVDTQREDGGEWLELGDGLYRIKLQKMDSYTLKMTYQEKEYSFRINCCLPQLALYEADSPSADTLVASRFDEAVINGGTEHEYYLMHDWDEWTLNDINNITISSNQINVPNYTFNKDALKTSKKLTKITIPKINEEIELKVSVSRGNPVWYDDFNFRFVPVAEGFVITYDDDGAFCEDVDEYRKNWDLDKNVDGQVSLATYDGTDLTPLPLDAINNLSITDDAGNPVDESIASIKKGINWSNGGANEAGRFEIRIKEPGRYYLNYGTDCVQLNVDYSDVAFTSEEATYYPEDPDSTLKINEDPYEDELFEDNNQLFEKTFYIGTYTQPEMEGLNDRREIVIQKIEPIINNNPVDDVRGFSYKIAKDGHTAKVVVNMNAISDVGDDMTFRVTFDRKWFYKEGGTWKTGRTDNNWDRWFHIYLGNDNRMIYDADEYNPVEEVFIGDGYDSRNQSFEYDGTEKAITLDPDKLPAHLNVEYEDNKGTSIGDYTAKITYSINDDYKTQYCMADPAVKESDPDSLTWEYSWSIVKPASVEVAEDLIEALPDTIKTSDEQAIKKAREAYDKLSDAEKSVFDADTLSKLEAAETALAKKKAEEEAKKKEEEEAKKKAEEEAAKRAAEKAAADKKAADAVKDKIDAIGSSVTIDSKDAIDAARKAYNSLSEAQKKLVDADTIKKLADAEAAYKAAVEANKKYPYSNEWIDGKWYDEDGTQTYKGTLQWKCNSTGWWVEDTDGWYPTDKWQKIDGVWYYFKPDGYMAAGEYYNGYWFNLDGSWDDKYLLSWKSNSTGWWVEDISGWWPSSSWLKIDGCWYYFDADGYMVTSQYVDGYWIDADGVCR